MAVRDYEAWLRHYDDPESSLSWRLATVQSWLAADLDRRPGTVRALSLCAGDGRDLVDVLAVREDRSRVRTVLVEAHPEIARRASDRAGAAGVSVEVRVADAADPDVYADATPADLVLLVGIFGNISDADISRTIAAAPQLCRPGATLIWSRGRDIDDQNDRIRTEFGAAGFGELTYAQSDVGGRAALGAVRYEGPAVLLVAGQHLFTFWR